MPPHDRLCRRLNGLVNRAVQQSRQHEPLLFLYPPWFAAGTSQAHFATTCARPESATKRTATTAAAAAAATKPERRQAVANAVHGSRTEEHDQDHGAGVADRAPGQAKAAVDAGAAGDIDSRPSNKLVKRIISKTGQAQKRMSKRQSLHAQYTDAEDWRAPFDTLRKHTPKGAQSHVKQLERLDMPPGMMGYYLGDLDKLFLEIYLCTDCHVQVSRGDADEGERFQALVLVGTPPSIRAAKLRLDDAIRVRSENDDDPNNDNMGFGSSMADYNLTSVSVAKEKLRAVWAQDLRSTPHAKSLSDILLPSAWDVISFANYIDDITTSSPPRLLRRSLYASAEDGHGLTLHIDYVTQTLQRLFTDPSLHPFISSHATSRALAFLTHHRRLPTVRLIIGALDTSSFRGPLSKHPHAQPLFHPALTTKVFNATLAAAASAQDVHNYNFLLTLLTTRSLAPDFATWTHLLTLVHARNPRAARTVVLKSMRERGLLSNPQAKMSVAAVLVKEAFADWVDRGGSTATFIETWDREFEGGEWLDTGVANRMLRVRSTRGQFDDGLAIVHVLKARGKSPDAVTLNTLVEEAAAQGNVRAVLRCCKVVLGSGVPTAKVRVEQRLLTQLFWMAKRQGAYNMLRVIWTYACLSGHVDVRVLAKVQRYAALPGPTPSSGVGAAPDANLQHSRGELFRRVAYKAILGVDSALGFGDRNITHGLAPSELSSLVLQHASLPTSPNPHTQPQTKTQTQDTSDSNPESESASTSASSATNSKAFFSALVTHDLSHATKLRPRTSFVQMLHLAAERDETWKLAGVRKTPDLAWILENIIRVEVEVVAAFGYQDGAESRKGGEHVEMENDADVGVNVRDQ